jgi:hypothetical protein
LFMLSLTAAAPDHGVGTTRCHGPDVMIVGAGAECDDKVDQIYKVEIANLRGHLQEILSHEFLRTIHYVMYDVIIFVLPTDSTIPNLSCPHSHTRFFKCLLRRAFHA